MYKSVIGKYYCTEYSQEYLTNRTKEPPDPHLNNGDYIEILDLHGEPDGDLIFTGRVKCNSKVKRYIYAPLFSDTISREPDAFKYSNGNYSASFDARYTTGVHENYRITGGKKLESHYTCNYPSYGETIVSARTTWEKR